MRHCKTHLYFLNVFHNQHNFGVGRFNCSKNIPLYLPSYLKSQCSLVKSHFLLGRITVFVGQIPNFLVQSPLMLVKSQVSCSTPLSPATSIVQVATLEQSLGRRKWRPNRNDGDRKGYSEYQTIDDTGMEYSL